MAQPIPPDDQEMLTVPTPGRGWPLILPNNAHGNYQLVSGIFCEPPVGIEPTTYSLRVNRSAD